MTGGLFLKKHETTANVKIGSMATILFEICDADYYDDYVGDGGGDDKDNDGDANGCGCV